MTQLPPMRRLEKDLDACGQLTVEQIRALAKQGIKTLIFNRPDQEEAGQPPTAELEAEAKSLGMTWHFQPVISGAVTDEQGVEFGRLLAASPRPVVAFCRSGARCGCLWALSKKDQMSGAALVEHLKQAGYDMPDFFQRLLQD